MTGCCFCFPPSAKVLTTVGYVPISDLKSWHRILTRKSKDAAATGLASTPFHTFLHYDPKMIAEFLVLICDNNEKLIISEKHLLYKLVGDGGAGAKVVTVQAKEIAIGDSLLFTDHATGVESHPIVTHIETQTITGVYAPLTGKGTLIVDGFQVSCYAEIESQTLAHCATAPLRTWYRNRRMWANGKQPKEEMDRVYGIDGYAKVLAGLHGIKI